MIPEDLKHLTNTLYVVDREYTLVDFNEGYRAFAIANDGADILTRWPIGSNILSSIPDIIRNDIQKMYDEVFVSNTIIEHEYDCHSPTVFRRFKMRILPFMDGFALHEHCLIESSELSGAYELTDSEVESGYIDINGMVHQCCYCRRIQSHADINNWVWVVALIERDNSFSSNISHTICPVCMLHYYPGE